MEGKLTDLLSTAFGSKLSIIYIKCNKIAGKNSARFCHKWTYFHFSNLEVSLANELNFFQNFMPSV